MKCSYCQNPLDNDAQFCPNCGTILGAQIDDNYDELDDIKIEDVANVFTAPAQTTKEEKPVKKPKNEKKSKAKKKPEPVQVTVEEKIEQPVQEIEQPVQEIEPEVQAPVQDEVPIVEPEPVVEEIAAVAVPVAAKKGKKSRKSKKQQDKKPEKYEDTFSNSQDEKESAQPAKETEITDIYSFTENEKQEEPTEQIVDETPVPLVNDEDTYKIFQPITEQVNDNDTDDVEEEIEDSSPKENKSRKKYIFSPILVAALALVIMLAINFDSVKDLVDKIGVQDTTTDEKTTEDLDLDEFVEVTQADEEETTEDETTEEETIEEETTEEETTEEETTTVETTTQAATTTTATTTAPSTTVATTTATATTQVSATTTTQSSSSTTTDPYGINDVDIVLPDSMLSSKYTVYVQYSGLMITNSPSSSSERIIYVEKGADLTVYAVQDGYSYVYSNRIGVYGWISNSNISTSRPVEETTSTTNGVELPDTTYSTYLTMYISPSDGLNLRMGPSTSYSIIKNLQQNYEVQVVGYNADDPSWVYIIDSTYGITGWVSVAYLSDSPVR